MNFHGRQHLAAATMYRMFIIYAVSCCVVIVSGYGVRELTSKVLQIQAKKFYLDVKENRRGRFIKISEVFYVIYLKDFVMF